MLGLRYPDLSTGDPKIEVILEAEHNRDKPIVQRVVGERILLAGSVACLRVIAVRAQEKLGIQVALLCPDQRLCRLQAGPNLSHLWSQVERSADRLLFGLRLPRRGVQPLGIQLQRLAGIEAREGPECGRGEIEPLLRLVSVPQRLASERFWFVQV